MGLLEKDLKIDTNEFSIFDNDYGSNMNTTKTTHSFSGQNKLLGANGRVNRMHVLTDAFSVERDKYNASFNLMTNNKHQPKADDTVSLIKASDYEVKDSKLVNDALFPRKMLRAIKIPKKLIKGTL